MYGLVNKAIEEMVLTMYGDHLWNEILHDAAVERAAFASMESYPDDVTYRLVKSAAKVLKKTETQVLESFGEYWITYTAAEGYGNLLEMAGNNLVDFLRNLDILHSCVGHVMPQLKPPSFKCSDISENSLKLHYYSERAGLQPMVVGLIRGLAKRFNNKECQVTIQSETNGATHPVFLVEWQNA